jgi:hypothetical protein
MKLARIATIAAAAALAVSAVAMAVPVAEEHVTGGSLDLPWANGFGVSAHLVPLTLGPADDGYVNPSGDHTVGLATTMPVDSGGIVLAATDPLGLSSYTWEGWIFTNAGNSRRGLIVRGDPTNDFQSCYQLVIQSGLLQMNFRKLVNSMPTTLGTWLTTTLPGGIPTANSWHHMKVIAEGNTFRCFMDGTELTTTPIVDSDLATGWVGVYNFRADQGEIPMYVDDLLLSPIEPTANASESFGSVKARYRR